MTLSHPAVVAGAALVSAPVFGALLMGVDRVLTARMQARRGPPVMQTFYDIAKLLRKEPIVVNRAQVLYAWLHLAFMILSLLMLVLGQDGLMFLFVFAFSTLALVLGGMSVRSPYSRIGSQREIILMVAYEPILILMMIGIYLTNGRFALASVFESGQPLLLSMPLVFVALLLVVAIKMQKSPFDVATSHHAHQELVKGITLEYSGPYLALIEIAHCFEVAILFVLVAMFWAPNWWIGLALDTLAFLLILVLDNLSARLTSFWIFRFMWTVALALALTNIVWLYLD
jgi:formate hydrogenlyase subunit 4